ARSSSTYSRGNTSGAAAVSTAASTALPASLSSDIPNLLHLDTRPAQSTIHHRRRITTLREQLRRRIPRPTQRARLHSRPRRLHQTIRDLAAVQQRVGNRYRLSKPVTERDLGATNPTNERVERNRQRLSRRRSSRRGADQVRRKPRHRRSQTRQHRRQLGVAAKISRVKLSEPRLRVLRQQEVVAKIKHRFSRARIIGRDLDTSSEPVRTGIRLARNHRIYRRLRQRVRQPDKVLKH